MRFPRVLELVVQPGEHARFWNLDHLLSHIGNTDGLFVAAANKAVLQRAGIYEKVLLEAFVGTPTNHWPLVLITSLFSFADPARLRAVGNPLPSSGPFLLYRGVAGKPPRRRVRGLSWTDDFRVAQSFACRVPGLVDQAVYRVRVREEDVLTYVGGEEGEYIVRLPQTARPVRIEERVTGDARARRANR